MPFVTTPRLLGAGQRIEVQRSIRAEWTLTSTDPRKLVVRARREADCHANEEILETDRDAITRLRTSFAAWRDKVAYNTEQLEDTSLAGRTFELEVIGGRARAVGSIAPEQRAALEREYATLGTPTAIDRAARVIADGMAVRDIGSLLLALLLRHMRGAGAYMPSMIVDATATLSSVATDIATFDVALAPADPTRTEELRMAGQLALGAEGWPRALTLNGTCARVITSRFESTTQNGTLSVSVTWTY